MSRRTCTALAALVAACAGACSSANLPTLPDPGTSQIETGAPAAAAPSPFAPVETATIAPGTPTEVYALVARGILGCWFGANGPLKTTHIFNADAAPPSRGGTAEIVLHERDPTLRDQRGVRAFRVAFSSAAAGVHVVVTRIKMPSPQAELMARDVETWAKGGSGCLTGPLTQPASTPPPAPPKTTKAMRGDR